jgi:hypothetical protein
MGDGRAKNGGARNGAGRKSKPAEDDLRKRLKKACKDGKIDYLDEVFRKLVSDAVSTSTKTRQEARKLLLAYLYGRPVERHEVTGEDGKDLVPTAVTVTIVKAREPKDGSGDQQ